MASAQPAAPAGELAASLDLRLRFVNAFPRVTRPLFAALRAELAPYGYTLSPLHPAHDLSRARMQTELLRIAPEPPAHYAPLIFELDPSARALRVCVLLSDGQVLPDFPDRQTDLDAVSQHAVMEAILRDYLHCIIDTQPLTPA